MGKEEKSEKIQKTITERKIMGDSAPFEKGTLSPILLSPQKAGKKERPKRTFAKGNFTKVNIPLNDLSAKTSEAINGCAESSVHPDR